MLKRHKNPERLRDRGAKGKKKREIRGLKMIISNTTTRRNRKKKRKEERKRKKAGLGWNCSISSFAVPWTVGTGGKVGEIFGTHSSLFATGGRKEKGKKKEKEK